MENRTVNLTYKQIVTAVSILVAVTGGEIAIGSTLFNGDPDKPETERFFVGFSLNESKLLTFTHTDGLTYVPIMDEAEERYYITLSCGKLVWCY